MVLKGGNGLGLYTIYQNISEYYFVLSNSILGNLLTFSGEIWITMQYIYCIHTDVILSML